jgi:hypothetical protein
MGGQFPFLKYNPAATPVFRFAVLKPLPCCKDW